MNWKASCSDLFKPGISRTLLRENFRRFWPIPVLAFLFYFLAGPFMILMNYGMLQNQRYMISNMMNDQYLPFVVLHVIIPVISAVIVFRYLQQPGNVTLSHSLPFSRSTLFNTNFVSGFLMAALPIIANGLIYFVIKRPVYTGYDGDVPVLFGTIFGTVIEHTDFPDGAVNIFTGAAIFQWVVLSLLTVLFIYTIVVFAGVVTGVSLLHFGFGLWFNFLLPLIWLCLIFYFDQFFFGFYDNGSVLEVPLYMNPILFRLNSLDFTPLRIVYFLAATALIALLSKWFYAARPMERVGDALTFRFMQPLLNYLMAFMAMTLFGLYFDQAFDVPFLGVAIGAVLGFIIGRMIVTKSLLIFNKVTLKSFAIYALTMILLMGSFQFDLFGYEDRIPEIDDIKKANFPMDGIFDDFTMADFSDYEDPAMLEYLTDIHREILRQRTVIEGNNASKTSLRMEYQLKNGWEMTRRYRLPYDYLYNSDAMRTYFNSPERRALLEHGFDQIEEITYVQIYDYPLSRNYGITDTKIAREMNSDYGNIMLYPNVYDLDSLIEAVKKDALDLNYAEALLDQPSIIDLHFEFRPVGSTSSNRTNSFRIGVTWQMTHTIAWLRDHGICDIEKDMLSVIAGVIVTPSYWEYDQLPGEIAIEDVYVSTAEGGGMISATTEDPISIIPDYFIYDSDVDPDKYLSETPLSSDPLQWDGNTVYYYHDETGTMQPQKLTNIQADLEDGVIITNPEDIREILTWCDSGGNNDRNLFRLKFLYKVADDRLFYRYTGTRLFTDTLAMKECDFTVSPELTSYMNNAFK